MKKRERKKILQSGISHPKYAEALYEEWTLYLKDVSDATEDAICDIFKAVRNTGTVMLDFMGKHLDRR